MSRLNLRINFKTQHLSDPAAVLAVTLVVGALLFILGLSAGSAAAQPEGPTLVDPNTPSWQVSPPPRRQYYATKAINTYTGANADGNDGSGAGVCALGYHFASMWEILDTSNLRYNLNQGASRADSGMGPPSVYSGWVRTGYNDNTSTVPGQANCTGWDQDTGYGTTISLPANWTDPALQDIHTWDAAISSCEDAHPVWCVANGPDALGACSQPIQVYCGAQVSGNTSGMPSHIDKYSCSTWDESGPDTIYALTLPPGGAYSVTATVDDGDPDVLDVFILAPGGCYSGTCQSEDGEGNESVTLTNLPPGTYHIAVDGYLGQAGAYTLDIDCSSRFVYLPVVVK